MPPKKNKPFNYGQKKQKNPNKKIAKRKCKKQPTPIEESDLTCNKSNDNDNVKEYTASEMDDSKYMSESNCSSKQFGTEDNSAAPSKLQDESRDFESSMNFEYDDDDEDDYDNEEGPRSKKKFEGDQDAALVDALHCIKTLLDESEKRDEHSIYGEHIAQKMRTCNRNNTDIAIAQHHIENIIFNLAMGVYNQEGAAALEDKTSLAVPSYIPPSEPSTHVFQPFVIPKPDPETNS